MKICITSQGPGLDSEVDPRFGRCKYFIIVDSETSKFEAIANPNIDSMSGAGIQSAQIVSEKQVKAVLTGNVGPNAFQTLKAAGIEVITGVARTVKEGLDKYKKGSFKPTGAPSVNSKFGMRRPK